jgi:hypothetical protein
MSLQQPIYYVLSSAQLSIHMHLITYRVKSENFKQKSTTSSISSDLFSQRRHQRKSVYYKFYPNIRGLYMLKVDRLAHAHLDNKYLLLTVRVEKVCSIEKVGSSVRV